MVRSINILLILIALCLTATGQNISINADGTAPDSSAMLDISSTTKGVLIPRMTMTQRNSINKPETGLLIFQTDNTAGFYINLGTTSSPNWQKLMTGDETPVSIEDADTDTKVQVEESSDEDLIRFDIGGTEYFRMEAGRLRMPSTNGHVIIGEGAGNTMDITIASLVPNVFIGEDAGRNVSSREKTIAIGSWAMQNGSGGQRSTAIGSRAFNDLDGGNDNTGVGERVFQLTTTGSGNAGFGTNAGLNNTTGSNNTYIGTSSGSSNDGSSNVFLGSNAGGSETATSNKLFIDNSNTTTPLIYGDFANDSVKIYGQLSVGDAYTFPNSTPVSGNVLTHDGTGLVWSTISSSSSSLQDADGNTQIQLEENTNENIIRFDLNGAENFVMNSNRLEFTNANRGIYLGTDAGLNDTQTGNLFIGDSAGTANNSGQANTLIGYHVAKNLDDYQNTFIGYEVGNTMTSGFANVVVGDLAMKGSGGNGNTVVGSEAFQTYGGNENVAIGTGALGNGGTSNSYSGSNNIAIGSQAGAQMNGSNNMLFGVSVGQGETISNQLRIEDLIRGDFAADSLSINGKLNVAGQYTFPNSDGTNGQVLQTDGSGNVNWTSFSGDSDWTQGSGIVYNTSDQFAVGTTSITTTYLAEFESASSQNYPITLSIDNDYTGSSQTFGLVTNLASAGSGQKFGIYNIVNSNASQSNSTYGTYNYMTAASTEGTYGTYNSFASSGTGRKTGVYNSILSPSGTSAQVAGVDNSIINQGSSDSYGVYTTINSLGTGKKYGDYVDLSVQSSSASDAFGSRKRMNVDGTGNAYGVYLDYTQATGSGKHYGIYSDGDDENYFSGNVGIGRAPLAKLQVHGGDIMLTSISNGFYISDRTAIGSGYGLINYSSTSTSTDPSEMNVVFNARNNNNSGTSTHASISMNKASNSDSTSMSFFTHNGSTLGEKMRITGSGNVGIGSASPNHLLEVASNSIVNDPMLYFNNSNASEGDAFILFEADAGQNFAAGVNGSGNRNFVISNSYNLESSERLVIDGVSGNVGIGTTSTPGRRLTVETSGTSYGIEHTNTSISVQTYLDNTNSYGAIGTVSNHPFSLYMNDGNPLVTLTSSTAVAIGNNHTTATSTLDVAGDIETGSSNAFYFGDPSTDGTWRIVRDGNDLSFERRESGSWVFKMKINP